MTIRLVFTNERCPGCGANIRLWCTPSDYDDDGHAHSEDVEIECLGGHQEFEDNFINKMEEIAFAYEDIYEVGIIQQSRRVS